MKEYKLGVIGGGFMARAIIGGALKSGTLKANDIIVSDPSVESGEYFKKSEVTAVDDNYFAANSGEYLLIAVKPQQSKEVFSNLKGLKGLKVISIMAGVQKKSIKDSLDGCLAARVMPNAPCMIGKGAAALDLSDFKEEADRSFVRKLFENIADIAEVDEALMDAVTGISGSGPAYIYLMADALIKAGIENGLDYANARKLAVATIKGGAGMLEADLREPEALIKNVCSKGGTTIEAMKVFEKEAFTETVRRAVNACVKRSKELSKL